MPVKRNTSPTSSSDDSKPYSKPSPSKSKAKNGNGNKASSSSASSPARRKWSAEEKQLLLMSYIEAASSHVNFTALEEKFEGRTATQIKDQWRQVLLPSLMKKGASIF